MWIRPLLSLIAVICAAETRLAKEVAANTKIVADIKKTLIFCIMSSLRAIWFAPKYMSKNFNCQVENLKLDNK
jgi:hypothetical protein